MSLWVSHHLAFSFFFALCITSGVYFLSPDKQKLNIISIATFIFLLLASPFTCIWLSISTLMVAWVLSSQCKKKNESNIHILILILCLSLFFLFNQYRVRESHTILFLGIAYYTCRHIHALVESHKGNLKNITFMGYVHYSFFLPVMLNGPIHRYLHFSRACQRRHFNWEDVFNGLERILYGYVKINVLGNYFFNIKIMQWLQGYLNESLTSQFIYSANAWVVLYLVFGGYTDVALGFAKIWGIYIEENFNSPFKARNLIEFWRRWHITLSLWCKDYIYLPALAYFRNPVLSIMLAMIGIGVWHELSLYYLLWGVYQALGVILCRVYQRFDYLQLSRYPKIIREVLTRTATFSWLFAAKPIILSVLLKLGYTQSA